MAESPEAVALTLWTELRLSEDDARPKKYGRRVVAVRALFEHRIERKAASRDGLIGKQASRIESIGRTLASGQPATTFADIQAIRRTVSSLRMKA